MSLKHNYSFISSRKWLYLEIECGLTSPVNVNHSYLQENKLRNITDKNLIKHFETIRKWTRMKSTPKVGLEKSRKTQGYFLMRLKDEDIKEIAIEDMNKKRNNTNLIVGNGCFVLQCTLS